MEVMRSADSFEAFLSVTSLVPVAGEVLLPVRAHCAVVSGGRRFVLLQVPSWLKTSQMRPKRPKPVRWPAVDRDMWVTTAHNADVSRCLPPQTNFAAHVHVGERVDSVFCLTGDRHRTDDAG